MAAKKYPDSVVVLNTHINEDLVIRGNPTDAAVRRFVKEHHKRYLAGTPGGPSGIPAFRIFNAKRYESEPAYLNDATPLDEIDIADLLATP